ncbi:MAG: glutaminyl-tRNA synthase (glutamine-hydrolyzing) subunit A [Candidatus Liptonbacteria bacterium RIFCSPLOWO2_01_FULL_53_13]|uniref:Glutamyl-tRNA(Gln) amidotransferase subunit A n=1 Tax=Candidatus Liptonbacteria bacterium RIFCSPLOWO2_01_FULL_53_13 TaxID=1798651 RepID=A0A1G2CIJ1_9BACT|nr:MAG: glutaminyl-tRNA synthase (glutamine-hydrolyzing) subunit A [Candidatus Liptonbacteria bacterium RIFCSPLOWO2_01_FULL_53_13]
MTLLRDLTIKKFHDGLLKKEFSALEITQAFLKYIKDTDPRINAYLSLREEQAIKEAEHVDIAVAKGESVGVLAGVPLAIKDNMLLKGEVATAASKILENYTASYDATVITKLRKENAVFLGKTNLDEFAMGTSTENSAFQVTKNPHDETRVAGGSSGGSAAAVAGHMAIAALGSDTGGSIRLPASFCGVVGLKATYGAVSRSGLIAMASSLDQIGPIAKTVEDAAILFKAIAGKDPLDATSAQVDYGAELLESDFNQIKGLTIGVPKEYFIDGVSSEVRAGVESAIADLKSLGVKFKDISLPHTKHALSCYYILQPAEVSSNLARFDGVRYSRNPNLRMHPNAANRSGLDHLYFTTRGKGFGAEVKRRIILGTFVLSSGYYDAYYAKAQQVRALVKQDFTEAFKHVDMILAPISPAPAFKVGEKADDPLALYLEDIFTVPINLAGLPSLAIPVRNVKSDMEDGGSLSHLPLTNKLPVGFQLIGRAFKEADILGMGQMYENEVTSDK